MAHFVYPEKFTSTHRSPQDRLVMSYIIQEHPDFTWKQLIMSMRKHKIALSLCALRNRSSHSPGNRSPTKSMTTFTQTLGRDFQFGENNTYKRNPRQRKQNFLQKPRSRKALIPHLTRIVKKKTLYNGTDLWITFLFIQNTQFINYFFSLRNPMTTNWEINTQL